MAAFRFLVVGSRPIRNLSTGDSRRNIRMVGHSAGLESVRTRGRRLDVWQPMVAMGRDQMGLSHSAFSEPREGNNASKEGAVKTVCELSCPASEQRNIVSIASVGAFVDAVTIVDREGVGDGNINRVKSKNVVEASLASS